MMLEDPERVASLVVPFLRQAAAGLRNRGQITCQPAAEFVILPLPPIRLQTCVQCWITTRRTSTSGSPVARPAQPPAPLRRRVSQDRGADPRPPRPFGRGQTQTPNTTPAAASSVLPVSRPARTGPRMQQHPVLNRRTALADQTRDFTRFAEPAGLGSHAACSACGPATRAVPA